MTAIVGVADGRTVWMGADSYAGNGYALQMRGSKIIRRQLPDGSPILFGVAGEMRAMLLLDLMTLPERDPKMDAIHYVGLELVNAMRVEFAAAGFATTADGREAASQTQMLVGYDGRLFGMWNDYTLVDPAPQYLAMGSGMYTALGALAVTEGIEPIRRLEMVLDATARHDSYVRRPFTFQTAERFVTGFDWGDGETAVVYDIKSRPLPLGSTGIIDIT